MPEQKFMIDTNSFITPYRQYYAFDFTRAFWEQLEQNINDGKSSCWIWCWMKSFV